MNSANRNGPSATIPIGPARVGRLLVGHNPLCGNSHLSEAVNADMRAYFTAENVVAMYKRAEAAGYRTLMIRADYRMFAWVEQYRREGGKMNIAAQTASEMHDIFTNIKVTAATGVEAVYHHGTQTDKFWREGRIDDCLPYLRCMRDCGVAVGLGTHQPEIIEYAEEHGWDVDFYMACFYNLSRVPRESAMVTGETAYEREVYEPEDPAAMGRVIRRVRKPVLGFKFLAAGRLCATQEDVRAAFRRAYANIKPSDGLVVGLFPRDLDQVTLDMEYARQACAARAEAN